MNFLLMPFHNETYMRKGWTSMVFLHGQNRFLPSLGIPPKFMGQRWALFT